MCLPNSFLVQISTGIMHKRNYWFFTHYRIFLCYSFCSFVCYCSAIFYLFLSHFRLFPDEMLSSGGSRISPRRGRQLSRGAPTYDFAKFSQKLHEIERIWTPRGGRASKILLCRSATVEDMCLLTSCSLANIFDHF